jgi:single-strand selective monofunctional uracil DNA glycosylase
MSLISISRELCTGVDALVDQARKAHEPVAAYIYNPLDYARAPHEKYLKQYGTAPKDIMLVGMNPGPFGMAQTGVPFGDVGMVRDFLQIKGKVGTPPTQHPKRLITGFDCPRSEVSGTRLWNWARDRFGTAEHFFARFFVVNYCPLVFMEESSRNLTPDKLPAPFREQLFDLCDKSLLQTALILKPRWVLGVGGFAEKRAQKALSGQKIQVGTILHPSPASPAANRGWSQAIEKQLSELGIAL